MPTILHNSSKACASLSPQPREFEGIHKHYKNSAGSMNPYRTFPLHVQLSQASHVSVCPKILCFKGILEPLFVWEKTGSEATRQLLQAPLSLSQHQWQRQCLPATAQAAAFFSLAPRRKAIIYFQVRFRGPAGDQRLPFLKCNKRSVTSLSIVTKISGLESDTPPALKDRRQRERQVIT